jgi:hypothetical protein
LLVRRATKLRGRPERSANLHLHNQYVPATECCVSASGYCVSTIDQPGKKKVASAKFLS